MKVGISKRNLVQRQQQVEALGLQAESLAERHFFKRLERLAPVRRFVITWVLFFVLLTGCLVVQIRALDGLYQELRPIPGGIYTEGVLGDFTTANPLYASGEVDESVSKLVFASLLKYDQNNHLVGDLASSWSIDPTERIYTVKLRPHLIWHDGAPLTARDVLFTYRMIQNPDALSYLRKGWQDISIAAPDDSTVVFTLPNSLSAFPHQMTNGIIPEHILKGIAPGELRSATFNTLGPIGAGPFMWQKIEVHGETPETREEQIALMPFQFYHSGGPKLSSFVLHAFHDIGRMQMSFDHRELTAASFLEMPQSLKKTPGIELNNYLLTAANMVFFRVSNPVLTDPNVRKALVQGANTDNIINDLGYPTHPVKEPFLLGQLGYDKKFAEASFNRTAAAAALTAAGWVPGTHGERAKGAVPLKFTLIAQDTPENRLITSHLQQDWRLIGVRADMQLRASADIQRAITEKTYDALLYGISIGVDPDVFVYWHSSQKDARSDRLNFSEYSSKVADAALEGGRTRSEPSLRTVKYRPFLQAWQQDAPALGLYQPRYLYATHGTVYGLNPHTINSDTDRFNNVADWQIREASVATH